MNVIKAEWLEGNVSLILAWNSEWNIHWCFGVWSFLPCMWYLSYFSSMLAFLVHSTIRKELVISHMYPKNLRPWESLHVHGFLRSRSETSYFTFFSHHFKHIENYYLLTAPNAPYEERAWLKWHTLPALQENETGSILYQQTLKFGRESLTFCDHVLSHRPSRV